MPTFLFLTLFYLFGCAQCHLFLNWDPPNNGFDQNLYKDVLDSELCEKQLNYILRNDTLSLFQFLDAGLRIPKGLLMGNFLDMGNYYQCLAINREIVETSIEGKYCLLEIPLNQSLFTQNNFLVTSLEDSDYTSIQRNRFAAFREINDFQSERSGAGSPFTISIRMAMCLPKSCTTKEALNAFLFNITNSIQYNELFCRIPNDKPWVPGDTVAVIILSILGLVTILSTSYDLWSTKIQRKDPKDINITLRSFSVFTNTRNVLTFKTGSNSLDCLDGLRSLSIMWVIVGHIYAAEPQISMNSMDVVEWMTSVSALWITAAPISVDTFFVLSGLLVVYVAAGRFSGMQLLKNVHYFYLNRLLRMFPILAFIILLEATLFNHVADGPFWGNMVERVHLCRTYWWSALLHIQNYVNTETLCLDVTWYLAIDVQLHILSPLLLFWVLGRRRIVAWTAFTCTLLASIAAATIYNFIKEFPSSTVMPSRLLETMYYMTYYYMNTLTRAPPFIIGMLLGYSLHIWKGHQLKISKVLNMVLWIFTISIFALILYIPYPTRKVDYESQIGDSIINSFMRPSWALGLYWLIFACVKGYGGPINWFLSLNIWKLPARLSYALYLLHLSIITIINSTIIQPTNFSDGPILFKFMGIFFLTMVVSFGITVLVDQPFSNLFKLLLGTDNQKTTKQTNVIERTSGNDKSKPENVVNQQK